MEKYTDQLNRSLKLEKIPQRIVSLVPSQTELLVDMGLREKIVGITKFCVHPEALRKEKEVVGGTKKVHFNRIKALHPDLILCNKEENTEEMVRELEKIAPVHVSDIKNIEDTIEMISQYGMIFQVEKKASEINSNIQTAFSNFQKSIEGREIKRVAYFIWKKPWMLAGKETFIDHLLQLNKLKNVCTGKHGRYPEVELPKLIEQSPEVILLSSEPFPFKEKHVEKLKKFFPHTDILLVDGEYFSWYGSRLTKAFSYFEKLWANSSK